MAIFRSKAEIEAVKIKEIIPFEPYVQIVSASKIILANKDSINMRTEWMRKNQPKVGGYIHIKEIVKDETTGRILERI